MPKTDSTTQRAPGGTSEAAVWRFVRPYYVEGSFTPWPSVSFSWVSRERRYPDLGWWMWIQIDWLCWAVAWAYDPNANKQLPTKATP